jgi:4-hydroxybenzoate polyprenyltransferase
LRSSGGALLAWSRPWRCIHYVGATFFGILLGYRIIGGGVDWPRSVLALVSVFLNFQGMVVLNNLMDRAIDEISGKKTPVVEAALRDRDYRALGIAFSAVGASLALFISYQSFLIVVAAHVVSLFYSPPPFRLKRFFPVNTILISLSTYLAMMFGYSLYGGSKTFIAFPPRLTLLFLVVFTLSMSFKDRLDERGDREGGVRTLFTLLGERKGSFANGVLMLASYCSVPLILHYPPLFLAAIPAGLLSLFFGLRRKFREEPIFIVYFLFADIFIFVIWKNISLVLP